MVHITVGNYINPTPIPPTPQAKPTQATDPQPKKNWVCG